jgi:aspartyl/asparaginyl beta-hydroxylase (cupin superfamily)
MAVIGNESVAKMANRNNQYGRIGNTSQLYLYLHPVVAALERRKQWLSIFVSVK